MMVHNLRESRNKAVVVFTKFTRLYKQHPLALYCFFEGEDSKYYGIRIEHIARPDKPIFFDCDGKEGVVGIYTMLKNRKHYSSVQAAYFIDRDFDISVYETSLTGIYETPCYSIENFYTSIDCFSKILRSEFKLGESDLTKLSDVANQGNYPYFTKKVKVTLNVSRKTVISILSQYADIPDCLYRYLESFRRSVS